MANLCGIRGINPLLIKTCYCFYLFIYLFMYFIIILQCWFHTQFRQIRKWKEKKCETEDMHVKLFFIVYSLQLDLILNLTPLEVVQIHTMFIPVQTTWSKVSSTHYLVLNQLTVLMVSPAVLSVSVFITVLSSSGEYLKVLIRHRVHSALRIFSTYEMESDSGSPPVFESFRTGCSCNFAKHEDLQPWLSLAL